MQLMRRKQFSGRLENDVRTDFSVCWNKLREYNIRENQKTMINVNDILDLTIE